MAAEESCYDNDSDDDEDDESNGLFSELDPSQFGENTPVKAGSRPQNADTWKHIKRLKDPTLIPPPYCTSRQLLLLHCFPHTAALLHYTRSFSASSHTPSPYYWYYTPRQLPHYSFSHTGSLTTAIHREHSLHCPWQTVVSENLSTLPPLVPGN